MTFTIKELRANGVDERVVAIREFRRHRKLTAKQFAAMAGVSVDSLRQAECGKHKLSPWVAAKCDAAIAELSAAAVEHNGSAKAGTPA